jgi:hypothetical protein
MSYRVERRVCGEQEWRQTHAGVGALSTAAKHARARVYGPPADGRVLDDQRNVLAIWLYEPVSKQMIKQKERP